jgi:hypothetical protein
MQFSVVRAGDDVGLGVAVEVAGRDDGVVGVPAGADADPGAGGPCAESVTAVQEQFAVGLAGDDVGAAVAVEVLGG